MSVTLSPETHALLLDRIPNVTGHALEEWFTRLENGPGLTRCSERTAWLADEHGLSHAYARAIVQEFDRRRRNRSLIPRQRQA